MSNSHDAIFGITTMLVGAVAVGAMMFGIWWDNSTVSKERIRQLKVESVCFRDTIGERADNARQANSAFDMTNRWVTYQIRDCRRIDQINYVIEGA